MGSAHSGSRVHRSLQNLEKDVQAVVVLPVQWSAEQCPPSRVSETALWTSVVLIHQYLLTPCSSVPLLSPHELHRMRREAILPVFATPLVMSREHLYEALVQRLLARFRAVKGTGAVLTCKSTLLPPLFPYLYVPIVRGLVCVPDDFADPVTCP